MGLQTGGQSVWNESQCLINIDNNLAWLLVLGLSETVESHHAMIWGLQHVCLWWKCAQSITLSKSQGVPLFVSCIRIQIFFRSLSKDVSHKASAAKAQAHHWLMQLILASWVPTGFPSVPSLIFFKNLQINSIISTYYFHDFLLNLYLLGLTFSSAVYIHLGYN